MPRKKHETAIETGADVFDQAIADRRAAEAAAVVGQVVASTELPPGEATTNDHAQAEGGLRKKWTPPADPFGFENIKGDGNRVRLLKDEANGAWVIRFEKAPNEMTDPDGVPYSKERPHPVIKMLKEEHYKWGFDQNGVGGWGKRFEGDAYGQDHIETRKVLARAAEMVGAQVDQGRIPD